MLGSIFFAAGLYMAVQEALESTVTADMMEAEFLATSYGILGTVNGTAKLLSSAAVGIIWTIVSQVIAFGIAAVLMGSGTIAMKRVKRLA